MDSFEYIILMQKLLVNMLFGIYIKTSSSHTLYSILIHLPVLKYIIYK